MKLLHELQLVAFLRQPKDKMTQEQKPKDKMTVMS